jgi:lipopolysaccharide export system protein LptC
MSARSDNLHSRLVFWLKILLPLAALVLLSTLFLVSRGIRPEDAIPYAEGDIADQLRSPRLSTPDFAGVTADGAAISLKAAEVRLAPDGAGVPAEVQDLTGLVETPDGVRTELSAHSVQLDPPSNRMILGGGVKIASSSGYRIATPELSVALDRTSLSATGAITATGPAFSLTAGEMQLGLADGTPGTYLLVFKGGVRMVYQPGVQGTTP